MRPSAAKDRRPPVSAAAAVCAMVLLCGCASNHPGATVGENSSTARDQAIAASLRRLEALATHEQKQAWPGAASAPSPPNLEPALAQQVDASPGNRSVESLDTVIQRLAQQHPEGHIERVRPEPEVEEAALRFYISGRQKALDGSTAGAIEDLTNATTTDPTAGEPWRELGEAQLAIGERSEARASFEKAAACGLNDPRVLEILGRGSLERGDQETAAAYLARAALAEPGRTDPLLAQVINVALWRALAAQGYITASRDVLLLALERPAEISSSTRYGSEAASIFRRQGDLWREVGDADCRLGQFASASDAYDRAQQLPSLESTSLDRRLVFAQVRAGRPAQAAIGVLSDIMATGRTGPESAELLRYLGQIAGLSPEISDALEAFSRTLPQSATIAGGLARAQAGLADPSRARSVLRQQAQRHPSDLRSTSALFSLIGDPRAAAAEAARLTARHPMEVGRIAEALVRSQVPLEPVMACLESSGSSEATLLLAYVEAVRGDVARASDRVSHLRASGDAIPAVALAQIEIGLVAGRLDRADRALARLQEGSGTAWVRARARGLAWLQRSGPALADLEPALSSESTSPDERLDDLILAGELATSLGHTDDAERWFQAAAAIDPLDERPSSRLLAFHGSAGPAPDPGRASQIVRDLRQTMPDSKMLRAARVQELLRRAAMAQAETEAMSLATDDPSDGSLTELATSVWKTRFDSGDAGALARGLEWIGEQLQRRPRAPFLLEAQSKLLIADGRADRAASELRAALDAGGSPDVSRVLERVLRDQLDRPDDAESLITARLGRPDRTVGGSIEWAVHEAGRGADVEAAAAIQSGIRPDATLTSDQGARLLAIASQIAQRALPQPDQARLAAAASLFDLAEQRDIKAPAEAHALRLQVLAAWTDTDADRMIRAAAYTAREFPDHADAAYIAAANALALAHRGPEAIRVISTGADAVKDPGTDILAEWLRVVVVSGTIADARTLIDRAAAEGKTKELAMRFADADSSTIQDWRAQVAYVIGVTLNASQRAPEANAAYELALSYDPHHAWAANNLGYALADKGVEIDRASSLLETAHAALPTEAAVTDSLGWLRYKQGLILDQTDPATGNVTRQGAVSLLTAASLTSRGQQDPTILDHLGDALWLAGRSAEALRSWQHSEQVASQFLSDAEKNRETPRAAASTAVQEARAIKDSAIAKRRAAASGQDVRVAPQLDVPSPRPMIATPSTDDGRASGPGGG
jgi:tetratricopeptide (TPR) repeat protein